MTFFFSQNDSAFGGCSVVMVTHVCHVDLDNSSVQSTKLASRLYLTDKNSNSWRGFTTSALLLNPRLITFRLSISPIRSRDCISKISVRDSTHGTQYFSLPNSSIPIFPAPLSFFYFTFPFPTLAWLLQSLTPPTLARPAHLPSRATDGRL